MEQTRNNNQVIALEEPVLEVQEASTKSSFDDKQRDVEEIDSSPAVVKPSKPASKIAARNDEPLLNPLLDDPYEWDKCAITVVYTLMPDHTVSLSVHNHKDEPIVKSFNASDGPLPEKISGVMETLRAIWPDSPVSATVVLLPKSIEATERTVVVSVRAGNDTPIVQTAVESNLHFPDPINTILEELKALLPTRALKHIEKNAKTKISPVPKPVAKPVSKTSTIKPTAVAPATSDKSQLSLF